MSRVAEDLLDLLRRNRDQHRNAWRVVRLERLVKLVPDAGQLGVDLAVADLVATGDIVLAQVEEHDGTLVPAITLTDYRGWLSRRWQERSLGDPL